jgi:hypothetical protein
MHGQHKGSLPKVRSLGPQQRIITMVAGIQGPRKMRAMKMKMRMRKRRRHTGMGIITIITIIIPSRVVLGEGVIMELHRELTTITHSAPENR